MRNLCLFLLILNSLAGLAQQPKTEKTAMKITSMIYVDHMQPELDFWKKVGFETTVTVPEGKGIGFAILVKDGAELMVQTRTSMGNDMPAIQEFTRPGANVYIEVPDFADLLKRVEGAPVVVPVRTTFYGMKEIVVKDPGGNVIVFSAKA